jgi:hypothetical protein
MFGEMFCSLNQITRYNTGSNRKVVFVSRIFTFRAIFEGRIKFVNSISILFVIRNIFYALLRIITVLVQVNGF